MLRGHAKDVTRLAFSPDGRWVVTTASRAVCLIDVEGRRKLYFLRGGDALLTAAAFDATGRTIVAGDAAGDVRTWACDVCGGLAELRAVAGQRLARTQ